ncbi:citrate synthase [Gordonia spumicola]|uniref:citrate synthase (unknown stereospecificity) n=1 Tax=Gordonia spumicola TaxID=589161 RepID=A0A7I9V971_9ACTN|nr:citrate/2-methylcitrate synthase [Gordonia spumicola]GEE01938.1 citrate synthase [Gordonia spumicola]
MQEWITTSEAADRLGVKRGTLYSYVSRGVLTSRRMPGQAESLFDRAEVDSLAAAKHDGRRAGDRLLRFRAVSTRVSTISDDRLLLRGNDIADICATMDFAAAARFVLDVDLPVGCPDVDLSPLAAVPVERRIPLAVALIAAHDPLRADRTDAAARVLGVLPILAATVPEIDLSHPWTDLLATTLIDNGLAASTTAARVAASARAGVFDSLLAGYAALSGPLHGGAPASAYALVESVRAGVDMDRAMSDAVVDGRLPGFGHVIYGGDDPRAIVVLDKMRDDAPDSETLAAADAIISRAGRSVNVDLASAVVSLELGLGPRAGEVLFQYGRTVGMAAHVIEEYGEAPLRWRGSNTGQGRQA